MSVPKRPRTPPDHERLDDPDFRYELYEASVQDPEGDVDRFLAFHAELVGGRPQLLREDFAGTFKISAAWVNRRAHHRALALDLDPEPLASGKRRHLSALPSEAQSRLEVREQDVRTVTSPAADLCIAGNFSSFIFKTDELMLEYFRAVRESLCADGIFLLEIAGGPGLVQEGEEPRTIYRNGRKWFTYVWHQQAFNPVNHDVRYGIHFDLKGGHRVENAFTYDWRLWTIPELRALLREAGFADTLVYMEGEDEDGESTGVYEITERAPNNYAWLAYVVGLKAPRKRSRRVRRATREKK